MNYRRDTGGTRMYIRRRCGYNLGFNPVPRRTLRFLARFNGGIFYGRLDARTFARIYSYVGASLSFSVRDLKTRCAREK